jgi:hypothetical protein
MWFLFQDPLKQRRIFILLYELQIYNTNRKKKCDKNKNVDSIMEDGGYVKISDSILSKVNLMSEEATWQDVGGSCSDKPKTYSKLYHEKYVPHARSRIIQLQTSTLQPSIAKPFAVIRSKFFLFFIVEWNSDKNGKWTG